MVTRRDFVKAGIAGTTAGIIVPPILAESVFAAVADGNRNNHVLVVVQLAGGNDGLNTVVPYTDSHYYDSRPTIAIDPGKVLPLNGSFGLNPAMPGIKALYDAGQVAVVQGVGYPTPTYSHFEGLYVWEHADPARRVGDGWLGKLLATQYDTQGHPLTGCSLGQASAPSELRAPNVQASVIDSAGSYQIRGGDGRTLAATTLYRRTPGIYGALFDQSLATAKSGIDTLHNAVKYTPSVDYGTTKAVYGSKNSLAGSLQLAAQMIVTEPTTKIIHVVLGGFDTHQDEDARQAALLADVDTAIAAFMKDLAAHDVADRVTLMTWSEFGRRLSENGGKGTDHGAAAPMFVIGKPVKGGMFGEAPSLTSLIDAGNLQYTTDFRSVYQSVMRDWLQADAGAVLGGTFPQLRLFNGGGA